MGGGSGDVWFVFGPGSGFGSGAGSGGVRFG